MPIVSREEVVNCLNPVIDVFIRRQGVLLDVAELEWLIEDITSGSPVQVEPPAGRNTADVADCPAGDRVSTGRYVAAFTVPTGFNLGTHRITWFFKQTLGGQEFTSQEEFEVLDVLVGSGSGAEIYTTVQSIRDEGVTALSDTELLNRIILASRYIDHATGRFFLPRSLEYFLDGRGHSSLFFQEPIIAIAELEISLEGINFTGSVVDLNDFSIYNRHLSQNLTRPDDRDDPKIQFKRTDKEFARLHALLGQRVFYEGRQNIRVNGVFGYTDPDGTANGKTPDLIAFATKLITMRNIAKLSETDDRQDALNSGNLRRLKTRDQEIEYQNKKLIGGLTQGAFTGDTEIDNIILMYQRPMDIATV